RRRCRRWSFFQESLADQAVERLPADAGELARLVDWDQLGNVHLLCLRVSNLCGHNHTCMDTVRQDGEGLDKRFDDSVQRCARGTAQVVHGETWHDTMRLPTAYGYACSVSCT